MSLIKKLYFYLIYLYNKIILKKQRVHITNKTISNIRGKLFVNNKGKLTIEDHVRINSRYRNNPIGGQTFTSFVVSANAELIIKSGVGLSNSAIVAHKRIVIEENVYIGGDCKIYDTDFHSLDYDTRLANDNDIRTKEVTIGKGAFIGTGSIILKGVRIGEKSIIGAGSVVTKSVPPNEIWAGNPARFIKKLGEEVEKSYANIRSL
ncbi:acyltransferase [Paenibacillus sp. SYP-B3998]|uniref:Acyltransferase n=1 Tax=Paenibacillus sp. SYP-B3998 TaxID=2678564 RepID=A0A6G4A002_9BACL|nr:acyltransferase [Paenibacillus sp. SYP-B3998]NEW07151.1 acyltransferase [Paenibacillus sp. SYP-B3998]